MKDKLFYLLLLGLVLFPVVSAMDCDGTFLGTFKQGTSINLRQTCDTCTYVTLGSIVYPNSTIISIAENMTKSGIDYNYTFYVLALGEYQYSVFGDKDGILAGENFCFEVTPSGQSGSSNQVFYLLFFAIAYGVGFTGFFRKNEMVSFLGGILMIILGLYVILNGVIIYRDVLTKTLSYVTLALGSIFMLVPAVETIEDYL